MTGSAAVGKTSFCRLLFQSEFPTDHKSTEIMEATQGISVENYCMVKQVLTKKVAWLKLDSKSQIAYFKSLLESRVFHKVDTPEVTESISEQGTSQSITSDSNDDLAVQDNVFDKEQIDNTSPHDPVIQGDDVVGNVQTDLKGKVLLSDALPDTLFIDKNQSVKLITVIDTGGQPEYIQMLPAFNNCPTINFIVIDMTKSLDENVMVQYKSEDDKEVTHYSLCCSNLNMIGLLMSLNIDSVDQRVPKNTQILIPNKPLIGFVGTHKDDKSVTEKRIEEINSKLNKIIDKRVEKYLLTPGDGYLFTVDNTTAGSDKEDPVVKILRQRINESMDDLASSHQINNSNKLPIKWMILELEMQELHARNYISYADYQCIATKKAKMVEKEVEECLQHFNFLGVFLHFKEVDGLCDYVIINHQWLFKTLAKLMHLSHDKIDFTTVHYQNIFKEKRLLAETHIKKIKEWDTELCAQYFFNLLVYFKVIATVSIDEENYYYMPNICSSTSHFYDKHIFLLSEPLLVRFSSGFLPRGFFCSLIVNILNELPKEWDHQLHNTKHFSNVITFRLPDDLSLCLHDKFYYLEVQIRHYVRDPPCIDYHAKVLPILHERFLSVCEDQGFNHQKLEYGFLCHGRNLYDDEHIAIVNPFSSLPRKLVCCRKDKHQTKLNQSHKIWFKEVSRYKCKK